MSILDIFGGAKGALDFGLDVFKEFAGQDRFEDAQAFNRQEREAAQAFNEKMYRQRYQMQTQDLIAAGLNPMLAYMHGAGSAPTSPSAQSPQPITVPRHFSATQAAQQTAQAENIQANTDVQKASADKIKAEIDEIKARTPTHAANIDLIRQKIAESIEQIENIRQQVKTGIATATNLAQHTQRLS